MWNTLILRALGAYMRHAPEHPGRWRLIGPAVTLAPALKHVNGSRVIGVREGFRMRVDGSSQTGRILYATGEYESPTGAVIKRLLRAGDTMLDVGANIGYFSILGARAVGPRGRVVAFEPMPSVRSQLVENIGLNDLRNVTVRSEALSNASGDATFYPGPADDTGLASLRPLDRSDAVRVTQARLDDIWNRAERIALIKMDVEGGEMAALEGMRQVLAHSTPYLVLEITDEYLRALGGSAAALYGLLRNSGYTVSEIRYDGNLVQIETAADLARCPSQFNALCTPPPRGRAG